MVNKKIITIKIPLMIIRTTLTIAVVINIITPVVQLTTVSINTTKETTSKHQVQ